MQIKYVSFCVGGSNAKAGIHFCIPENRDTTEMYPRKVMHIIGAWINLWFKGVAIPTHNVYVVDECLML